MRAAVLAVTALHPVAAAFAPSDPIILLPSFAGSVLDATLHHADKYRDCETTSATFNLYASSEQFTLRLHCMINNMALQDDTLSATGCLNNRKGLTVTPRDWGGTEGVSVVNPDDVSIVQTVSFARFERCFLARALHVRSPTTLLLNDVALNTLPRASCGVLGLIQDPDR